ncbi:MAG: lasso peptide biosynthesis PqqD family chaperone [Clostridiaceae bacterium]|nr:lasso peptide biosynthesis PqqD family chaperone [Clostridiaceae bacterium]
MESITMNMVITRNSEIVTADMDGETVMMSIENEKYYNLGKMGSVIWGLLEAPLSVEALIGKLLDKYDVDRGQCEKEVFSFLSNTYKEGLIKNL